MKSRVEHGVVHYKPAATLKVTTSGTSAQSAAITALVVKLTATAAMFVEIGANPTAVAPGGSPGSMYLGAGETLHTYITPGDKIAAIQDSAAGVLYITPVA